MLVVSQKECHRIDKFFWNDNIPSHNYVVNRKSAHQTPEAIMPGTTKRNAKTANRGRGGTSPMRGRATKTVKFDVRFAGTITMDGSGELGLGDILGALSNLPGGRNRSHRRDE